MFSPQAEKIILFFSWVPYFYISSPNKNSDIIKKNFFKNVKPKFKYQSSFGNFS